MPDLTRLQAAFDRTPANRLLGTELCEATSGTARVRLRMRPEIIQEKGVVHGGILATLADTAAVYALVPDLDPDAALTSVEFKINFLRPGVPDGGDLEARSQVVRRGRTLSLVDVDVFQNTRHLAKGLFTYITP